MAGSSNGNGRQQAAEPPQAKDAPTSAPKGESDARDQQKIEQGDTPVAKANLEDAKRIRPDMSRAEMEQASPDHLWLPDPLPPLDRPIFEPPPPLVHLNTISLHPGRPHPAVESAIEEIRMRLGEMREFLKRFSHDIGGELGDLVNHLRGALNVPKPDPEKDAARRTEDAAVAAQRRDEDAIAPPSPSRLSRRAEEDAGRATIRRVQDGAA